MFLALKDNSVPAVLGSRKAPQAWKVTTVGLLGKYFFIVDYLLYTSQQRPTYGTQAVDSLETLLFLLAEVNEVFDLHLVFPGSKAPKGRTRSHRVKTLRIASHKPRGGRGVGGAWVETETGSEHALEIEDIEEARLRCTQLVVEMLPEPSS